MKSVLVALTLILGAVTSHVHATEMTADQMTCEQAVSHYEKHNRIYVWTGNDIVPIYGPKPASKLSELRCTIKNSPRPYTVVTRDTDLCVIGYSCMSN